MNFLFLENIMARLKKNNIIFINVFCYENSLVYPVHVSDQKFKNLLLIPDLSRSHYDYIKDLCAIQQSVKLKCSFVDFVSNILVLKDFSSK